MRFDDEALPWWKWRKLQLFWVDGNWFYGQIPEFLPTRWPELRKLDLYDNNLEGSIPKGFGELKNLGWVTLNHNNLSGEVPSDLFAAPRLEVNLNSNSGLTGCVPSVPQTSNLGIPVGVTTSSLRHIGALSLCTPEAANREALEL